MHQIGSIVRRYDKASHDMLATGGFQVEHSLRVKIARQSVQHPLMPHLVIIVKMDRNPAAGGRMKVMLAVTEDATSLRQTVVGSGMDGEGHIAADGIAALRQYISIVIHDHAVAVELHSGVIAV